MKLAHALSALSGPTIVLLLISTTAISAEDASVAKQATASASSQQTETQNPDSSSATRGSSKVPVADYQFDGNLLSENSLAPQLFATRTGSTFTTENVLGVVRPVRTFDAGNGLRLDNADDLIVNSTYTIQMAIRIDDFTGGGTNFVKLIDYNLYANDTGFYVISSNGGAVVNYFDGGNALGTDPFPNNAWTQVVLTRDVDRQVKAYIDGAEQFTYQAIDGATDVSGALVFLDDDLSTNGNEISAGAIACLRIYDSALSSGEVANLDCRPLRVGLNGNACEFATITEAVAGAQSGDTLFIEAGTYNERIGQISDKDLTLVSSQAGSNCSLSEPFPGERVTIDGTGFSTFSGTGGILDIVGRTVNLQQIRLINGATGQGGLVTVRNGGVLDAFGSSFENGSVSIDAVDASIPSDTNEAAGGCVYAEGAELTFAETLFTNCNVVGGAIRGVTAAEGDGGAIHARANSTVIASNQVSFIQNTARNGGAVALDNSAMLLVNVGLAGNVAALDGGALKAESSEVLLFDADWSANIAGQDGGAISIGGGELSIIDAADFELNDAGRNGGAILAAGTSLAIRADGPLRKGTRFVRNSAGSGGAIRMGGTNNSLGLPTIDFALFEGNTADSLGGAISLIGGQPIEIVDSRFINNSAAQAGALYSQSAQSTIRSSNRCQAFRFDDPNRYCSEFLSNTANNASGVLYGDSAGSVIQTTSFVANSGPQVLDFVDTGNDWKGESLWFFNNQGDAIRAQGDSVVDIRHVTFDSNTGRAFVGMDDSSLLISNSIAYNNGLGGVSSIGATLVDECNIDQSSLAGLNINPFLTETADGLSHLAEGSPAVDACTNQNEVAVDLDGRDRVFGSAPDMGAFEFNDRLFQDGLETIFGVPRM